MPIPMRMAIGIGIPASTTIFAMKTEATPEVAATDRSISAMKSETNLVASRLRWMMLLSRWIAKHTRRGFREQQETLGELNSIIEETVTGQRVVKAYVREAAAIEQFDTANRMYRNRYTQFHYYFYIRDLETNDVYFGTKLQSHFEIYLR